MRIAFSGYAADCTIDGEIELDADRLKDLVDQKFQLVVLDAKLVSLDDGRTVSVSRLELDRADLVAAVALGPRGPQGRRIRTVRHDIVAQVGPYTVVGDLHDRPGVPPMSTFHTARPLVSFTNASISFLLAGRPEKRRVATLLVNREHVQWLGPGEPEGPAFVAFATGPNAMPIAAVAKVEDDVPVAVAKVEGDVPEPASMGKALIPITAATDAR